MRTLILLLLLAAPAFAGSFRLTAEFLHPNNSVRPVVELPSLVLTPGTTSDTKYSSKEELLDISRDHTLTVTMGETKDGAYELVFKYYERTTEQRTDQATDFSFDIKPTMTPGVDQVFFIDQRDPQQGVFRIKIDTIGS